MKLHHLVAGALVMGALTACGGTPERPTLSEAKRLISETKTVSDIPLDLCLSDAGFSYWVEHPGIDTSTIVKYRQDEDHVVAIFVEEGHVAPWELEDETTLRMHGCTIVRPFR